MNAQRGFTLVEILVSMLILAFIVTTSILIVTERERRLLFASETVIAYQALANEAEVQRRISFHEILPGQTDEFHSDPKLLHDLPGVIRNISIKETYPGIREVTMTLRWRSGNRTARLGLIRTSTGGEDLW